MIHCHNAVHEDNGMMGIFNITKLADLGYKDLETGLEDPMDPRFHAKPYTGTNLEEIKSKTLPFFASLNAYPDPAKVAEIEDRYWSTRTPPSGDLTGPPGQSSGMMGGMSSRTQPKSNTIVDNPTTPITSSLSIGTSIGGSGGMNGNSAMGSGNIGGGVMMSGASTSGGATGCSPHNSHHGGCRRR
jgi:hypothetical protein